MSEHPITIIKESRRNIRISLTQKGIVVRVPKHLTAKEQQDAVEDLMKRFLNKINKKGHSLTPKKEEIKDRVSILGESFILKFDPSISERQFKIEPILNQITLSEKAKETPSLTILNKIVYAFLEKMTERVRIVNNNTVRQKYNDVTLKNIRSKWGSCSNKGILTFSNRLLLKPLWVIDYVIVHELCHLVHFDHSKDFWNLVGIHYPKYKEAKLYLKGS